MNSEEKIIIEGILGSGSTQIDYQLQLYREEGIDNQKKCSAPEKELRKKLIRKMITGGINRRLVVEYCSTYFGITPKQVSKYLTEINQEFSEISKRDSESNYGLMIERLEAALSETVLTGDMKNRVSILKELSDVLGIKTVNHNISGDMNFNIVIDDQIEEDEDDTGEPDSLAEEGLEGS